MFRFSLRSLRNEIGVKAQVCVWWHRESAGPTHQRSERHVTSGQPLQRTEGQRHLVLALVLPQVYVMQEEVGQLTHACEAQKFVQDGAGTALQWVPLPAGRGVQGVVSFM